MAATPTSTTTRVPSFLSSLDRATHEAYLAMRGQHFLERTYRELAAQMQSGASENDNDDSTDVDGDEQDDDDVPQGTSTSAAAALGSSGNNNNKRSRSELGDVDSGRPTKQASTSSFRTANSLPRIDASYRLELVAAKPDAAVLVLGEPPSDILASMPMTLASRRLGLEQRRAIIAAIESRIRKADEDPELAALFYDADKLPHHKLRALAQYEWNSRQLNPSPPSFSTPADGRAAAVPDVVSTSSAMTTTTVEQQRNSRSNAASMAREAKRARLAAEKQEQRIADEIAEIRRTFCDKNRAGALRARAAVGW